MAVYGEYWLIDGVAEWADGHTGKTHTDHVWQHLLACLADDLTDNSLLADIHSQVWQWVNQDGGDPPALRELINNAGDTLLRAGKISEEICDNFPDWVRQTIGWDEVKWRAFLDTSNTDLRTWAVEHLGWIRVHGNACELWKPSRQVLKSLADGLYEAYEDATIDQTFLLDFVGVEHVYDDVPFAVIDSGSLTKLRQFRRIRV